MVDSFGRSGFTCLTRLSNRLCYRAMCLVCSGRSTSSKSSQTHEEDTMEKQAGKKRSESLEKTVSNKKVCSTFPQKNGNIYK